MEQGEELRDDALHLVGHEHLVAIELNLIALQVDVLLDTWEIEDTCKVERIVHIQVDLEQRFVLHGVEGAIERLVVLILQGVRSLCPQWFHAVDDIILSCIHHFLLLT